MMTGGRGLAARPSGLHAVPAVREPGRDLAWASGPCGVSLVCLPWSHQEEGGRLEMVRHCQVYGGFHFPFCYSWWRIQERGWRGGPGREGVFREVRHAPSPPRAELVAVTRHRETRWGERPVTCGARDHFRKCVALGFGGASAGSARG